jgi:signal transduction histidine kinase
MTSSGTAKLNLRRGLAFKMILSVFSAIAVIFVIMFLYNYSVTRRTVIKNLRELATYLTDNTVTRVDRMLVSIARIPDNFAVLVEQHPFSETELKTMLAGIVENNREIFGAAIAFEPYWEGRKEKYYAFYAYRDAGEVRISSLGGPQYDYFTMDWYQIARETNRPAWTEPYYDEGGGNIVMTTYSTPVYIYREGRREFAGILTADVSLKWLQEMIDTIRVFQTGYGFLISQNGTFVTHPDTGLIMNASLFSLAEERGIPYLRELGRKMVRRQQGFSTEDYENVYTHKKSWIAYQPIPSNGWSLGVVFPVDEFMSDARKLNQVIILLGIAGLLVIFLVILFIARSVTQPLRKLTIATGRFATGDFETVIPHIRQKDEIGRLTGSFRLMQQTLAETIGNLRETSRQLQISNEKLEEYSRTLELRVKERTAELVSKNSELDAALQTLKAAQAQLIQSEKMASLGQLTAGIAHEIKNPLNFVNNFAELSVGLAKEVLDELERHKARLESGDLAYFRELMTDLQTNSRKIHEHGQRADSIIRGMLLHSRGKAGERQPTDLNALLAEYVNLSYHGMRASDPSFNIKIESSYDPGFGMISVIPQDISRAFLNILNNACQATVQKKIEQKGSYFPVLTVSTRKTDHHAEIRIRDNGKGIAPEIRDRIFEPFFTTKPAGSGTGLGLSISFDIIVGEHGGEIRVDSEPGEYTEFLIRIPC